MAEISVTDPDEVRKGTVDDRGRVYVGTEYNGEDVRVVMEVMEE